MTTPNPSVTYANYLQLDQLLSLQQPRADGPEHDELLFIVIHQVYELWFKEVLHELDRVALLLRGDEPHRVQHTLKRILTILKVLVAQLDILETMTPLEFLSFRSRLEAASGFQSDQFRQIEFVLGAKSESAIARFPAGSRGRAALERRYREPTLWDAFLHYLKREGYPVPTAHLTRDVTAPVGATPEIQEILLDVYRKDAKIAGHLRAARGSRRRLRRMALPPRADGRTDDRRQAWHGRLVGSRVSAHDARAEPVSRSVGNPRPPVGPPSGGPVQ